MSTALHGLLKRSLSIDGRDYILTLTPDRLKLTLKGKRNGVELRWAQLVSGEAALAVALNASLRAFGAPHPGTPRPSTTRPAAKPPGAGMETTARSPTARKPARKRRAVKGLRASRSFAT